MTIGYAQKTIKSEFKGYSNSSSRIYRVIQYVDSTFSCDCPAWIYHRGSRVDCKHILEIKNQMQVVVQEVGEKDNIKEDKVSEFKEG